MTTAGDTGAVAPPAQEALQSRARCPACDSVTGAGAVFCENCGVELPHNPDADRSTVEVDDERDTPITLSTRTLMTESLAPGPEQRCPQCGGTFAPDGYCETCGIPRARARDHFSEEPAAWLAGVCHRGRRHATNEDALALAADTEPAGPHVLVICDGVSNTAHSDVASLAAARAARDLLASRRGKGLGVLDSRSAVVADALREAAAASLREVVRLSTGLDENPPSCTWVAAVVEDGRLSVGNIGDSRAYWLPDHGQAQAVTVDDSLAAEQVAAGMPRTEAESGPQAHAITRWLGVDAPEGPPRIRGMSLDEAGWVLLCSDGLWNYCSEATDMAALVRGLAPADSVRAMPLATALVEYANEQGGQDNISVAVCRVEARSAPSPMAPPGTV
jgi:serine/threonine protein phosphatase PrpC